MVLPRFAFLQFICLLVLICTLIDISSTRSTLTDENEDAMRNYLSFNGKIPFDDDYFPKTAFPSADLRLNKRIIMLPRVGRRSIQTA